MTRRLLAVALLVSPLLLSACGGGGGDTDSADTPPSAAQGLWLGTTPGGRTLTGLVFGDGAYYVFYSTPPNTPPGIAGVLQGTSGTGTAIWSSTNGRDFNLQGSGVQAISITAKFLSKGSFEGTISSLAGEKTTFASAYDPTYEVVPTLAAVAGTYTGDVGIAAKVQPATVVVAAGGELNGSSLGCAFSGTVKPRTDGNAYDLSLRFGAEPCALKNESFSGIVYFDAATKRLYAAAPNSTRTTGVLFRGTKP